VDGSNLPEEWDEQAELPLPRPKVVPLGRDERLSGPEQAELYRRCPVHVRDTLRVILTITGGRRRLFASQGRLIGDTGRHWATVKRHRAALVVAGILEPHGGGSRGRGTAVYVIRTPAEVDRWLADKAEAEAKADAPRCPVCGESPPSHVPRRCPSFGRPEQRRMDLE
jgi:hypothetical protein